MVQDSCHTQLHLEVQKVVPRVFEEEILFREMESKVTDMLEKTVRKQSAPEQHALVKTYQ